MKINEEILEGYLENGRIEEGVNQNLIHYLRMKTSGNQEDVDLNYSKDEKEFMRSIAAELRSGIEEFVPNNLVLWETLFPDWKERMKEVTIYLLVGLAKGYDAVALADKMGNPIMVYDIGNWLIYKDLNLREIIGNLLTHELCHIGLHHIYPELRDTSVMTYKERLNAISFDEGFAHLLSFENQDISSIDWDEEKFEKIFMDSKKTMEGALMEKDQDKQEEFIQASMTGAYQDKFGAMLGMIYLARQWTDHGNKGLVVLLQEGYKGFLSRVMEMS